VGVDLPDDDCARFVRGKTGPHQGSKEFQSWRKLSKKPEMQERGPE
jgi:hypothetical protein